MAEVNSQSKWVGKPVFSALYQTMLRIRLAEERIIQIYPSDKIQSPVHLSIGQEAVSAGVCHALFPQDHIYGTYRSHGIFIAKGGGLKELFAELYGKETGCSKGKGGSMHLTAPERGLMGCSAIVSSTIPVATGDALASNMQGRKRVVVSFFGDGAVDEGVFFESINFAALKSLPIIFVCENNHYAIHSKVADRHKETAIYRFGENLGLPGERVEGNDVGRVYLSMKKALGEVRSGGGPRLLEYTTYRWYEHVGPGKDHTENYREPGALANAMKNDPLKAAETALKTKFNVSTEELDRWKTSIGCEIDEAVAFAERSAFPKPENLFEDVYEVKR